MLTTYETRTKQLLQNPAAPSSLYATSDLDGWINQARGQLAGEAECCRYLGSISTSYGTRNYNFSAISTGVAATTGIQGALNVRSILYAVGTGNRWVRPRPWEWYQLFKLNNPISNFGPPEVWAQYGQGAAGAGSITGIGTGSMASGTFWLDPVPELVYSLTLDCTCYPIALTADTTVEAIPYLWTDAVPYLAAYYALMASQANARMADAERYYQMYQTFVQRGRQAANPSVNRYLYEQANDPAQINKLGVQKSVGQG